jgi:prepilin-type N-terminal cleavage/methylation domain-containing protein
MLSSRDTLTDRGYTLLEMLVTLSIGATLLGIAVANLREYNSGSKNSVALVQGFIKQVRVKGISRTAAYKVYSSSAGKQIFSSFANTCSSTVFTPDTTLVLDMPQGSKLLSPTWSACFNARGLAQSAITISIATEDAGTKRVELMLGGGTREL